MKKANLTTLVLLQELRAEARNFVVVIEEILNGEKSISECTNIIAQ